MLSGATGCGGVREEPWTLVGRQWRSILECGFCVGPEILPPLDSNVRECSGDAGTFICKQGRGHFATRRLELDAQPE